MRKVNLGCVVSLVVFLFTSTVYASSIGVASFENTPNSSEKEATPLSSFEITSGMNKATESTFDASRTIVGVAPKDTNIILELYTFNEEDESLTMVNEYSITVGTSGVFSQSIDLALGQNHICVTAAKDSDQSVQKAVINRKDIEIKMELEQSIVLPGQNPIYSRLPGLEPSTQAKR